MLFFAVCLAIGTTAGAVTGLLLHFALCDRRERELRAELLEARRENGRLDQQLIAEWRTVRAQAVQIEAFRAELVEARRGSMKVVGLVRSGGAAK